MGQGNLVDLHPIRRFLLEETQHRIGGFGKFPGNPPGAPFPLPTNRTPFFTMLTILKISTTLTSPSLSLLHGKSLV